MDKPKRNYSRAELAARNRYNAKTYEALTIRGKKGWKNIVKAEAERQHESLNGYIMAAIMDRVNSGN
jgi:predicted HicB family RNase H-like nuclease